MNRALLIAGALAILAAPALAQSSSPSGSGTNAPPAPAASPSAPTPSGAGSSATTQETPSTADFVKKAAISGQFEIETSELALRKKVGTDRSFARRMIHDHKKMASQLKRLVHRGGVKAKLPAGLDDEHRQMLAKLRGESGSTFAKDYEQMQQDGHKETIALFQDYAKNGDNASLKSWASKALPELQSHLAMAEKLS